MTIALSTSIFKAYDIRGIIDQTLDPSIATLIGQSFGSCMKEIGEHTVVVGRDGGRFCLRIRPDAAGILRQHAWAQERQWRLGRRLRLC
jgi:phosphomannomutase